MKFRPLVEICFWLHLAVKGLMAADTWKPLGSLWLFQEHGPINKHSFIMCFYNSYLLVQVIIKLQKY